MAVAMKMIAGANKRRIQRSLGRGREVARNMRFLA
jgi:hypothetical protein